MKRLETEVIRFRALKVRQSHYHKYRLSYSMPFALNNSTYSNQQVNMIFNCADSSYDTAHVGV